MCANFQSKWTTLNFSAQIFPEKDVGKSNVGIRINIVETFCVPISAKLDNFEFFGPNLQICPKMDLGFEIQKTNIGTRIRNLEITCTNFQVKWTSLTFLAQICPKMDLGSEIQKTNVGIRISIVKMPCVPIFRKNGQLWLFRPKFAQKWILGSEFQKSKSGFGICTSKIRCVPIFS